MLRPILAIAAAAFIALAFTPTEAAARGEFGGGFHGGFGHGGFGFRGFGPAVGLGIGLGLGYGYGYGYPYYAGYGYGYGGGCVRPRRVWTAYGWRIVPVNVCGYRYGYGYY